MYALRARTLKAKCLHGSLDTWLFASDLAKSLKTDLQSMVLETARLLEYVGCNLTARPSVIGAALILPA